MNWGKGITLVFIAFALFIGTLVTVCVRQDVNLVSKDYYEDELNYQDQIDRLNNAAALKERPLVTVQHGQLTLSLTTAQQFEGVLTLTRPSDARYDAVFNVGTDSLRTYDLSKFPNGRYNVSLRWKADGKEFLSQSFIDL